jgi:hypothetical protein
LVHGAHLRHKSLDNKMRAVYQVVMGVLLDVAKFMYMLPGS